MPTKAPLDMDKLPRRPFNHAFQLVFEMPQAVLVLPDGEQLQVGAAYHNINKAIHTLQKATLQAETIEAHTVIRGKADLLFAQKRIILSTAQQIIKDLHLNGVFVSISHIDGRAVVIPAEAWNGQIMWDRDDVTCNDVAISYRRTTYINTYLVDFDKLSREEMGKVREYSKRPIIERSGNTKRARRGRTSYMHIVIEEYLKRKSANLIATSTKAEAEYLAVWFKKNYGHTAELSANSIRNALGKLKLPK